MASVTQVRFADGSPKTGSSAVIRTTWRSPSTRTMAASAIVGWLAIPTGPTSACWNIGVTILPEFRGKGYGTAAQRLLAEYLFATTTVNRVEAGTDVDNVAEQRALEKARFIREGVRRGSQFRNGQWRDMAMYGRLRDDHAPATAH